MEKLSITCSLTEITLQGTISSAVIDVYISIFSFPLQLYMEVSHNNLKTLIYIYIKKKKATKKS